jgi:hypothetical protein
MQGLRTELLTFTRACEHLLSIEFTLTDEERTLLAYYVREVSKEFLVDTAKDTPCRTGTAA